MALLYILYSMSLFMIAGYGISKMVSNGYSHEEMFWSCVSVIFGLINQLSLVGYIIKSI